MNCTKCGMPTEVVDTEKFSMYVWRRRRCLKCKHRMSTHENFVDDPKAARTKKPTEGRLKEVSLQNPPQKAEVVPLPIHNPRKRIEDLRDYLESKREDE